uniref:Uncharacterized protein n=1 Tax=Panagrolaimus davidi TaxID=227884 RepID=A0A914P0Z8_9BILA
MASATPYVTMELKNSKFYDKSGIYKATFRFHLNDAVFPSVQQLLSKFEEAFKHTRKAQPNATKISICLSSPDPGMSNKLPFDFIHFDNDAFDFYYAFLRLANGSNLAGLIIYDDLDMEITTKLN